MHPYETLKAGKILINTLEEKNLLKKDAQLALLPVGSLPPVESSKRERSSSDSSFAGKLMKWGLILGAIYLGSMLLKRLTGLPSVRLNVPAERDPEEVIKGMLEASLTGQDYKPPLGFTLHLNPEDLVL